MIRIDRLNFTVGNFSLRDVSLHVPRGEYFVLLGKPGSGKTVFLECIAGLNRISAGTIEIDERRVEKAEPRDRGIGYVPQDYALFSRRSVRGNVEFPLRLRGYPRERRHARIGELADMLGIHYLLPRRTQGLSGGETQRVALARAIAAQPKILLLDEPVSALDHETREAILLELRRIHRRTNTTTIHVCHDLDEMHTVADRVGILRSGRLVQVGTPREISRQPADEEVAGLLRLGMVLSGTAVPQDGFTRIQSGDLILTGPGHAQGKVSVLIRAAEVHLQALPCPEQHFVARVESLVWRDPAVRVHLRTGATFFLAELSRDRAEALSIKEGLEVAAICPPEAIYVFHGKSPAL